MLQPSTSLSQREVTYMTTITIPANDLQALLDVSEGYTAENGLESVGRYALPEEVQRAISNAKAAIRRARG